MIKITDGFKIPELDLDKLRPLPIKTRAYGSEANPPVTRFEWMQYPSFDEGSIGFAKRLDRYMPEVVDYTATFLKEKCGIEIERKHVSLLRTLGTIRPHYDEYRSCSINIGLINSEKAITRSGTSRDPVSFLINHSTMRVEPGSCYLLDTRSMHSVQADDDTIERWLLTVSFLESFTEIKQRLGL